MTENSTVRAADVKRANRELYDLVADQYEAIDGRRTDSLKEWVSGRLADLQRQTRGKALLDLGTGSGFVSRCGAGIFGRRVGFDISPRILAASAAAFDHGVAGESDRLPFADRAFDVVTCFAVLHHLSDIEAVCGEIGRVLKPGGIFWSDHDLDSAFSRRFRWPLSLYRRLSNARGRWIRAHAGITPEMYDLAEIHEEDGIDTAAVARAFRRAGLRVSVRYHWYGLTRVTDRVFGRGDYGEGWAPVVALTGRRE